MKTRRVLYVITATLWFLSGIISVHTSTYPTGKPFHLWLGLSYMAMAAVYAALAKEAE